MHILDSDTNYTDSSSLVSGRVLHRCIRSLGFSQTCMLPVITNLGESDLKTLLVFAFSAKSFMKKGEINMKKNLLGWILSVGGAIAAGVGAVVLQEDATQKYVSADLDAREKKLEEVNAQDSEKSE